MSNNSADYIDQLPNDKNPPSQQELQILENFFTSKKDNVDKILNKSRDILIASSLFFILSLPQIDTLIKNFFPTMSNSLYVLLLAKTLAFAILFFIVKNIYLVKQ